MGPNTAQELHRAQIEQDAESLAILINRRLYADRVPVGDDDAISAIVEELAPGWDYVDATIRGQDRPRVELSVLREME